MKISFEGFLWYDFWIGAYNDQNKHKLFICPLPCIVFALSFGEKK